MTFAEEKVPGGKLVRVSVAAGPTAGRVMITGDFFMHPEEGIALIEGALSRMAGAEPAEEVERLLQRTVSEAGIELIGVDIPTIVRLYHRCLTCGE